MLNCLTHFVNIVKIIKDTFYHQRVQYLLILVLFVKILDLPTRFTYWVLN